MTNRPYEYYPAWDGKQVSPGVTKMIALSKERWKTSSLGAYVHRNMNNDIKPPQLSVHATGSAWDCKYANEAQARVIWDWLLGKSTIAGRVVEHSKVLGISEIHWYAFGTYGAGYRCSRGEGKTGVKIFTATTVTLAMIPADVLAYARIAAMRLRPLTFRGTLPTWIRPLLEASSAYFRAAGDRRGGRGRLGCRGCA